MNAQTLIQVVEYMSNIELFLRQYEVDCQNQTVSFNGIDSIYKLWEIMDHENKDHIRKIISTIILVRTNTDPFLIILKPDRDYSGTRIENHRGELVRLKPYDVVWHILSPTINAPQREIRKMLRLIREHVESKWYSNLKRGKAYVIIK